eukprot:GFKZ01000474.1.p1 GENE.GFKZ01000474.1~~GFKZ01000474.1.p1  ORF type:complete len:354 (+),score=39.51 GFKZ01000474.1:151-1062(+)
MGKNSKLPSSARKQLGRTETIPPDPDLHRTITKRRSTKKLSSFQQKLQSKLDSGHFRMLNESMYKTTGAQSLHLMKQQPHLFQLYHSGYAEQVKRWPENPLDVIIQYLNTQSGSKRIADLGCGEARLAREVAHHRVNSFDLLAANENVTQCDIANVPLPDSSVDVAVFCLSLMGTNYGDFIVEARRILAPNGLVIVTEVASRFADHNPAEFVRGVEGAGFRIDKNHPLSKFGLSRTFRGSKKRQRGGKRHKRREMSTDHDSSNHSAFFYMFVFRSTKKENSEGFDREKPLELPKLAPCVYKKR